MTTPSNVSSRPQPHSPITPRARPQLLAVVVGLFCAQTAAAQTAISNLAQPSTNIASYVAGGHVNGFSYGEAVSFTTGSTAVDFTGATFFFVLWSPYAADTGLHVNLYSGFSTSGPTGSLLATLNGAAAPSLSATPAAFAYTVTTPVSLAPNTTYWLKVDTFGSGTTNNGIGWAATTNVGGIDAGALAGWTYFDGTAAGYTIYFTNSGGSSWSSAGFSGTNFPQYSVQYQAAAVPEPAVSATLIGLAALGFKAMRRRAR